MKLKNSNSVFVFNWLSIRFVAVKFQIPINYKGRQRLKLMMHECIPCGHLCNRNEIRKNQNFLKEFSCLRHVISQFGCDKVWMLNIEYFLIFYIPFFQLNKTNFLAVWKHLWPTSLCFSQFWADESKHSKFIIQTSIIKLAKDITLM